MLTGRAAWKEKNVPIAQKFKHQNTQWPEVCEHTVAFV